MTDARPKELAYNLDEEDLPVYMGQGLGNMTYEDVIDLSMIRREARKLRADKDFIAVHIPRLVRQKELSYLSRASKNNPYICPHCDYRTPRCGNMVKHLVKIHQDYSSPVKRSK